MNFACQKWLGNYTKVLGKIPKKNRCFFWKSPLSFWPFSPAGLFCMGWNGAVWSGHTVASLWTPNLPIFGKKFWDPTWGHKTKGIGPHRLRPVFCLKSVFTLRRVRIHWASGTNMPFRCNSLRRSAPAGLNTKQMYKILAKGGWDRRGRAVSSDRLCA